MSIKTDVQDVIQDVFTDHIDGISKTLTYHWIDANQVYDPETGTFTGVAAGGGGPLFNDTANSHWFGII